jgi:hypothetical protein
MSEPAVTQTLAVWLETAGPKRCIMWIAETCDEIAVRDIPEWKFWLEMGSLLRSSPPPCPPTTTLRRPMTLLGNRRPADHQGQRRVSDIRPIFCNGTRLRRMSKYRIDCACLKLLVHGARYEEQ